MVRRMLLILSVSLVLLFLVGLSLFFYFQPSFYVPPKAIDFQIRILDGELVGRQDGEVRWRLFVQEMEEIRGDMMTFTGGVYGEFYQRGELEYKIWSAKILYHVKTKDLEFVDEVVLETEEGDVLTSDLLLWDDKKQELSSPGPVDLVTGGNKLFAKRMIIYHEDETYDFWEQVVLSVPVPGKGDQGEDEDG